MLIFGNLGAPEMGVKGAGLATTISIYLGTAVYFLMAWRHARGHGFLHGIPGKDTMITMLRVSIPSGVQQFLFAFGMTLLMTIMGMIGTAELAAANVLLTLGLVAIFALHRPGFVGSLPGRKRAGPRGRRGCQALGLECGPDGAAGQSLSGDPRRTVPRPDPGRVSA